MNNIIHLENSKQETQNNEIMKMMMDIFKPNVKSVGSRCFKLHAAASFTTCGIRNSISAISYSSSNCDKRSRSKWNNKYCWENYV